MKKQLKLGTYMFITEFITGIIWIFIALCRYADIPKIIEPIMLLLMLASLFVCAYPIFAPTEKFDEMGKLSRGNADFDTLHLLYIFLLAIFGISIILKELITDFRMIVPIVYGSLNIFHYIRFRHYEKAGK